MLWGLYVYKCICLYMSRQAFMWLCVRMSVDDFREVSFTVLEVILGAMIADL